MRYAVFNVPGDQTGYEDGAMPSQEFIAEMMKYNEQLANAGILVSLEGFHPSSAGAKVTLKDGNVTTTDGPFVESKEVIGGYWIWNTESKQEALDWAMKCPLEEGDVLELRQIFEMEEFSAVVGPEEVAAADRVAEKIRANR